MSQATYVTTFVPVELRDAIPKCYDMSAKVYVKLHRF
jgi:hypothetical protein